MDVCFSFLNLIVVLCPNYFEKRYENIVVVLIITRGDKSVVISDYFLRRIGWRWMNLLVLISLLPVPVSVKESDEMYGAPTIVPFSGIYATVAIVDGISTPGALKIMLIFSFFYKKKRAKMKKARKNGLMLFTRSTGVIM